MMKNCMNDMCRYAHDMKRSMNKGLNFLSGLSLKNKADIDFQLKSKGCEKPLFNYKTNCDKEIRLMPVIGVILGIMLIITLVSDCSSCKCGDKDCDK